MAALRTAVVALWAVTVAVAQRRYYSLTSMPVTNFDCRDKILGGYYADPEANCQMFHVCVKIPGQGVQDFRFLCPNETVFDQEQQICADSGDIDCAATGFYLDNFDLYRLDSLQAKRPVIASSKGTPIPLGPSTRSPILTNQVQDDDDFYLQRSDTGDRRLHSKDILKGSSSSNLFNNRNRGKDLDDDDVEDDGPRNPNETPQSYRPKSSQPVRGKSQYNTQFRRTDPVVTSSTTVTTTDATTTTKQQRVPEEKKRTKIAVRKLARKRPTTEEVRSTPATSFTTQLTQKLNVGDFDQRYSTINRSPAPSTQQPQRPFHQNFRAKTEPTSTSFQPNYNQQNSETTPSYQPNYQQQYSSTYRQPERSSPTPFQNNHRNNIETSTPAFFEPNSPQTPRSVVFNGRPIVAGNYQPRQQEATRQTLAPVADEVFKTSPSPVPQTTFQNKQNNQQFNRQPVQNAQNNQQFNRQPVQNTQNNQQFNKQPVQNSQNNQQFNKQPVQNSQNNQQFNRQPVQNAQNNQQFNRLPVQNQQNNNQNFARKVEAQPQSNNQFNRPTPNPFPNHQTNAQVPQNNFQQNGFQGRPNNEQPQQFNRPQNQQQFQNQPTTGFARSTPGPTNAPNYRAQTINAALQPQPTPINNNVGFARQNSIRNEDFDDDNDQQEFLKTAPSSNFRPSDINSFSNNYKSDTEKGNYTKVVSTTKYYTPTIVTTPKALPVSSTTHRPQPPSTSAATSNNKDDKDASYDYAYYDDAGAFSEYDALDVLGETDFSRTSKRTKSRLI